jgi:hypothetical protein
MLCTFEAKTFGFCEPVLNVNFSTDCKPMKNYKTIEVDIRRCYEELREEWMNFSGDYEGNPYNGINVFGNGIYTIDIALNEIMSDKCPSNNVKIGIFIMALCKLAKLHSDSLDHDENPIEIAKLEFGFLLRAVNGGSFNDLPEISECFKFGFSDPVMFSEKLLDVYKKYVVENKM